MDVNNFSEEQLAGQHLMVGCHGISLNENFKELIERLKVGGIILFGYNIESPDQVKNLCSSIQDYAIKCGQPRLFISIDQEGGIVSRLKKKNGFEEFLGNNKIKAITEITDKAIRMAEQLKDLGINMNLAPVLDVVPKGFDESIMKDRVFDGSEKIVSVMGSLFIRKMQEYNVMSVAKHFPGIGRTTLDSHLKLPELDTKWEEMKKTDLLPFEAAVGNDVAGIMLSHILYKDIDPKVPASLSKKIVSYLREDMGYCGVVMTDDLDMKAVKYNVQVAVSTAVQSGVDIVLVGQNLERDIRRLYDTFSTLLNHYRQRNDFVENGVKSVKRILDLKKKYSLI